MATKEGTTDHTATENQSEVINALSEILTGSCVSSEALRFFDATRFAFGRQLDGAIQVLLDAGEGLPDLQRSLMTALCVHLIERLLLPPSDAPEIQPKKPPALSACERLYREQKAKAKPVKRKSGPKSKGKVGQRALWLRAKIASMTDDERSAHYAREAARTAARRERLKTAVVAPGS